MMEIQEIIIKPQTKWVLLNLQELWRFRELFYIFTWRNLKVRYKQTILGISWVLLQPLITMVIFTIFFGKIINQQFSSLPYPLFVLVGLTFWTFFSSGLTNASNSLLSNEDLVKKVYFPKIILPVTAILTSFVDFIITLILLTSVALFFNISISFAFFFTVALGTIITLLAVSGLSFFLSSFNVKYRDVKYILPFFIQLLLFVSPVIYATPKEPIFRYLMALNPITGVIETVRSSLIQTSVSYDLLIISTLSAIVIFILGLIFFNSTEKFLTDII